MTAQLDYDVVVIGAGPGGYVAAARASQLGLKTAIVEREYLGGVCLNVGCIPSKSLITAAHFWDRLNNDASTMGITASPKLNFKKLQQWKSSVCEKLTGGIQQLMKGHKVEVIWGEARFTDSHTLQVEPSSKGRASESQTVSARNFIVATGSRPIELPAFAFDEKRVLSSTGALGLSSVPKSLAVIGGGYIGLEIGEFLATFGTKVTILEAGATLLSGAIDDDLLRVLKRKLKEKKIEVLFNTQAVGYTKSGSGLQVAMQKEGQSQSLEVDKVLVTVGRRPCTEGLGLEGAGVRVDERGAIIVSPKRQTSIENIYAIGDVVNEGPGLAHKANYEGLMVAEILAGRNRVYDPKVVPAVIFTDPEIASVGLTELEAKSEGRLVQVSKHSFNANGRALSMMETSGGFVKIVADERGVVLGVHMIGPDVSNLISEAALAIEMGATVEDLAWTIHPHPTLSEALMESAHALYAKL